MIRGKGKEEERRVHLLKSTLSLSEVVPKEVANVRSFPNVTDAHPSPRLPLDALLRGLPSLARLAHTQLISSALLKVHTALATSTDALACQLS